MSPLAPPGAVRHVVTFTPMGTSRRTDRGGRQPEGVSLALVRPLSSVAWELRAAWATGRRVALSIDGDKERDDETRAEGFVTAVSATGAFCKVSGLHVPLDRVLAVHHPTRLGDTEYVEGDPWRGPVPLAAVRDPRQLELIDEGRVT